ncbi:alpha-adducin isoform X2 [Lethenteron reissneri]|uniref:alpha-adducin isoform X2 n=1 Tax=Lethenteron reissneri TaxID=7753 RepID=UPI002AB69090|nr:alpha-adducin isoform X2 [Lethenteron reissneri]
MNGDSGQEGGGVVEVAPVAAEPPRESYLDRMDDPEFLRERNMAADLRQDFNMMEQRKRVSVILQSPAFRDELESLIQETMKKGKDISGLKALQQIADYMLTAPGPCPTPSASGITGLNMGVGMVIPINDLRGSESSTYVKGEKLLRCKLAAVYRLVDLYGWSQLIYNHLSARVNKEQEHFLLIPFGLLFSEVTASSLVKVNLQGEIVDRGSTNLGINQAGFTLHSAIYAARPDIKCVIHVHTPAGTAVSAMKCGLLPISQEAMILGEVTYHDYEGILVDDEEKANLQKNLGPTSKVLILRNHGLVALGETVEEAFHYLYNLVMACEVQVRTLASAGSVDNVILLDEEKLRARTQGIVTHGNVNMAGLHTWGVGEQELEALMRMMDSMGYRTGYAYRNPVMRERPRQRGEVEIPATSFGLDDDSMVHSPLKFLAARQQRDKTRWLNSPNAYMRVEVTQDQRNGAGAPKTKWLKAEDSPKGAGGGGAPLKVEDSNMFVPLGTDPREVLETRNKIREHYRHDVKTAGPQSQLLCGAVIERPQGQEVLAASKAIIVKEFQTDVKLTAPPNPFRKSCEREIEEYRREVESKQQPGGADLNERHEEQGEEKVPVPPATPPKQADGQDKPSEAWEPNAAQAPGDSQPQPQQQLQPQLHPKPHTLPKPQPAHSNTQAHSLTLPSAATPPAAQHDEATDEEALSKRLSSVSVEGGGASSPGEEASPEASPAKSPSKKKKKFRTPSFLAKMNKKKEKAEA